VTVAEHKAARRQWTQDRALQLNIPSPFNGLFRMLKTLKGTFKFGNRTKLALDLEQTIVFGEPLAARQRAGLDLAAAHDDGEISDEGVFRFARAMRDDVVPAGFPTGFDRPHRLGEGADLIELDEHRVGRTLFDSAADKGRVGHIEIIAYDLDPITKHGVMGTKGFPIVFGEAVLD
jgi:hypothetical protein